MRTFLNTLFLDHPRSVNESYVQHLVFASKFAGALFLAAGAALVHALIPSLCAKTASKAVHDLHQRLASR